MAPGAQVRGQRHREWRLSAVGTAVIPRGIRNNNPGNLRWGQDWLGLVSVDQRTDPDFCQFTDVKYGIRAMAIVLKTYARECVQTIREAITRWSPPSENNAGAYVADVCAQCNLQPDQTVDLKAILPQLIPAIIRHEQGQQPYSSDLIAYGIALS